MSRLLERINDRAIARPHSCAVICKDVEISYQKLSELIDATSLWLGSYNIRSLGLHCNNNIDWIVTDLAAVQLGIPVIPIPGFFSEDQIEHLVEDSKLDAILSDNNGYYPNETHEIAHFSNSELRLRRLKSETLRPKPGYAKVTYTSGSTGSPKGVCLTQATIESVVEALSNRLSGIVMERHLCMLPFATLLENIAGNYLAFWNGQAVIVGSPSDFGLLSNTDFSATRFADAVQHYKINSAILLPQMLKSIVENSECKELSSLNFLAVGGGKTSPDLIRQAHRLSLPVYEGYGLSETASVLCINTPSHNRIGSVGRILDHADVSLSEESEVIVRRPIMQGYLHDSTSRESIATGDIGHLDGDGYLYISGRKKNCLISSFGRNISPEWVESHLLNEPSIHQVVVFGEAESHLSAVVVSQKNTNAESIQRSINGRNQSMPDYAQIKSWVLADSDFNTQNGLLTANGKPKRDAIYQHYRQCLADGAVRL